MVRVGVGMFAATALLLAGCGKITFGEALVDRDGGMVRDGGPRDGGVPRDGGPPVDGGCIPHTLPGMPEDFPWRSDRETVESLFLRNFDENGCPACHASDKQGASVVFPAIYPDPGDLPSMVEAEYAESTMNLWNLIKSGQPATFDDTTVVGRLWYHHPAFDGRMPGERDPFPYNDSHRDLITRLSRLFLSAAACNNRSYLAMPADAGSMCGDPMMPRDGGVVSRDGGDAGEASDAGDVDGGTVDSGSGGGGGSTGLCYCDELPDAGITPDLVQYCL